MDNFTLAPNEYVLLRADHVSHKGSNPASNNDLILTNLNLIVMPKGWTGKTKGIYYYPLCNIRVIDGNVQVRVGKMNGEIPCLEIYMLHGQEYFQMKNKSEANKWRREIISHITLQPYQEEETYDFVGKFTSEVAKAVQGAMVQVNKAWNKMDPRPVLHEFCPNCGTPESGKKGDPVKCPRCGATRIL